MKYKTSGTCSSYDDCHEEVEITYVVKTVTINAKLESKKLMIVRKILM